MAGKKSSTNKPSTKTSTKKKVEAVEEVKEEAKEVVEDKPVLGKVANCGKVRLRTTPEKEDNVIVILDAGTEFDVLDNSNPGWTRVKVQDHTGWIMSDYVELV